MTQFTVDVSDNIKEVAGSLRNYERKQIPTATQRALNKTIDAGFTIIKNVMKEKIAMAPTEIGKRMKKTKAPAGGTEGRITIYGKKPPNLASFPHVAPGKLVKGKVRLRWAGVKASVWQRKGAKKKLYKGTFVWERGDSKTIFKRVKGAAKVVPKKRVGGDGTKRVALRGGRYKSGVIKKGEVLKRQPLKAVFGADLVTVFEQKPKRFGERPRDKAVRLIRLEFKKKLDHEISRIRRR